MRRSVSTTGANRCRPSWSWLNASSAAMPAGSVTRSVDMTLPSWVKRSTPSQSASVTTPTARPSSMMTTASCARFGSRLSASPTVSVRVIVIGVS